jgi:hypothetical protein
MITLWQKILYIWLACNQMSRLVLFWGWGSLHASTMVSSTGNGNYQMYSQLITPWTYFSWTLRFSFSFLELGEPATIWPTVPAPDDGWWWLWSSRWDDWQGKPKHSNRACPSATLSTTYPWARTRAAVVGRTRHLLLSVTNFPAILVTSRISLLQSCLSKAYPVLFMFCSQFLVQFFRHPLT